MLNKIENIQSEIILYTLEDLVPEDSLFRKIDKYIDFTFIYDEVKDLYCSNNGRNWENSNKDKISLIDFFQNFIVLDSHLKI